MSKFGSRLQNAIVGDGARKAAAEKMLDAQQQGKSMRQASNEALVAYRKLKKDEGFVTFNEGLLELEKFSFNVLRKQYQDGLAAQDRMTLVQKVQLQADRMRGGDQARALDEMKEELRNGIRIIDSFTPSERRKSELINREAISRVVSELSLTDKEEVKKVLEQYEATLMQWDFLHRERAAGRPLPTCQSDLEWMLRERPTKLWFRMMASYAPAGKRRKRGRHGRDWFPVRFWPHDAYPVIARGPICADRRVVKQTKDGRRKHPLWARSVSTWSPTAGV
eukprot:CAMPEP_0119319960 /NCGR_PEP_ID=MMETSP1333-20130426/50955_1 /TAXON_ID=418940 /ORGANISM="Scyphosphaera apsteinii, Strain RCC1455" /LENGTH=278 /DNA_ID=CAMNT_0007326523 /DNA_START=122 /DNA_END=958 /DNA_ORIENTATION=-